MRRTKEKGAIVVEATISLTAFIFTIFTILSIVNIYFIQAKMGVALNSAAKEISQYSYLYYVLGVDKLEQKLAQGTEESKKTATDTIDGAVALFDAFESAEDSIETGDIEALFAAVNAGTESVESLVELYSDKLDDPKAFIIGMGKMAGNELKEEAKVFLAQVLAKAFMKKNLVAYDGDDPDAFLKRYRVVDGLKGLDFDYSALMAYGSSNQIQLVVTYDVSVIKLLNIDYTFKFRQCSKTTAWGNGISLITPEQNDVQTNTVWDQDALTRGKAIVLEEKKKYTYTSSGQGFDAYEPAQNKFVTIMSLDTDAKSYDTASKIKNKINSSYNSLQNKVSELDTTIEVQNESGATVSLNSPKNTRTYKVVLVVPSDAGTKVEDAVNAFKASNPGVEVVVKRSYGKATPKSTPTPTPEPES